MVPFTGGVLVGVDHLKVKAFADVRELHDCLVLLVVDPELRVGDDLRTVIPLGRQRVVRRGLVHVARGDRVAPHHVEDIDRRFIGLLSLALRTELALAQAGDLDARCRRGLITQDDADSPGKDAVLEGVIHRVVVLSVPAEAPGAPAYATDDIDLRAVRRRKFDGHGLSTVERHIGIDNAHFHVLLDRDQLGGLIVGVWGRSPRLAHFDVGDDFDPAIGRRGGVDRGRARRLVARVRILGIEVLDGEGIRFGDLDRPLFAVDGGIDFLGEGPAERVRLPRLELDLLPGRGGHQERDLVDAVGLVLVVLDDLHDETVPRADPPDEVVYLRAVASIILPEVVDDRPDHSVEVSRGQRLPVGLGLPGMDVLFVLVSDGDLIPGAELENFVGGQLVDHLTGRYQSFPILIVDPDVGDGRSIRPEFVDGHADVPSLDRRRERERAADPLLGYLRVEREARVDLELPDFGKLAEDLRDNDSEVLALERLGALPLLRLRRH